ncbi:hypothetical protein PPSIR1_09385 [Plesiocystis pacifica SIR-1]|uniref:Flavin reductase like domain-containing protein n=1 Tax=Plesiocystis pacifica SIR-1 TaxID=391625 RepID=A6GJV2_9BACT|nr:flavin reductase family protein [Plesiocystis pacifica]EDM73850.1 hypothetical protein PPSIR1_09385 [Plesiocystis pacifica SIR-1]
MAFDELPASDLRARDCYRLMTDIVAPRPIAWVSTVDGEGRRNLAPYSYFQAVCSNPPTVIVSAGWLGDGRPKDTLRNALETGQLTINHVSGPLAEAMNASSASYPEGVSEWGACGVEASPAVAVAPPRVAGARAGLECRVVRAVPLGETRHGTPSATVLFAEVVHFWVAEGILRRDGAGHLEPAEPAALEAVGRLGGLAYARTTDTFELARPKLPE